MRIWPWLLECAPRTATRAFIWFLLLTVAFTWPVAPGLFRDIPRDLGDSLLNCWILGWNADHFLQLLQGRFEALGTWWHGNIYHPEPYTLAYSELLIAPALQILPIYALTHNLILCYNLLFLSTFALSGLGVYLLVRAYIGDWRAAFLAGLFFAFTPYRINQSTHLQVMSAQWMPFALYGFHRFVETRRLRSAIGGAIALVAQNLSCGYFLIYFSLFVPFFVLFEIWRARVWSDARVWAGFALAAVIVAVATLPAMQPYLALRDLHGSKRSLEEIQIYSADALGWWSADDALKFWGPRLRIFVKPEGQLFPGAMPLVLAAMAVAAGLRRAWTRVTSPRNGANSGRRWLTIGLTAMTALAVGLSVLVIFGLRQRAMRWLPAQSVRLENLLIALAVGMTGLSWCSTRVRGVARSALRSPFAFVVICVVMGWYLSLGPDPSAGGLSVHGPRLYEFLLDHVPGLDGLRVPARFAMIVILFLSVVAGWGARDVMLGRSPRVGAVLVTLLATGWLAEAWVAPLPTNGVMGSGIEGIGDPPARIPTGANPPALARFLQALPENSVLIEFPFGSGGWEMRAVYYSTLHWRPIVNGFSGYAPESYTRREKVLRDPFADPETAWKELVASGATHIVVHGQAYLGRTPPAPHSWLEQSGARFMARIGVDEVYEVQR
jgi:hypothetical protein